MSGNFAAASQVLALVIQCATIITLVYTLNRFLHKPNATQNDRLDKLEKWREQVDRRLSEGSTHFDEIDRGNRATQEAILALIDHAIDNNHIEKLIEAKDNLQKYLINK